ncbi:Uncharacterised protein [Klebsiella pneumoniae]|nr:Uncharacterised protein [Klebsiella pneumoniae]
MPGKLFRSMAQKIIRMTARPEPVQFLFIGTILTQQSQRAIAVVADPLAQIRFVMHSA